MLTRVRAAPALGLELTKGAPSSPIAAAAGAGGDIGDGLSIECLDWALPLRASLREGEVQRERGWQRSEWLAPQLQKEERETSHLINSGRRLGRRRCRSHGERIQQLSGSKGPGAER